MTIRGLQLTSFVDFPGEVCTTVFFGGCNCRCHWCHNAQLVNCPETLPMLEAGDVLVQLKKRKHWIQAVCLTGGEPTLSSQLISLIQTLKENGFIVKLDTNGTSPDILAFLLQAGLLDYVAMDVKAPPEKYNLLTGVEINIEAITESIGLLKKSNIAYEFRTTVVPGYLDEADFEVIGIWLAGAGRYVLQQYRPPEKVVEKQMPYPKALLLQVAEKMRPLFAEVQVKA